VINVPERPLRHLVRSIWLVLQVLVVGFVEWAIRFGGADHHLRLLLTPVMAVLLFPGFIPPVLAIWAIVAIVEAVLGVPVYATSGFLSMAMTLGIWVLSAWLTDLFWRTLWNRFFDPNETVALRIPTE
jgi:hypothetical protein